ncbi:MAG: hypothetical protein KKC99_11235, partial [Proteobacteria bacterium]|nr:hypothetical protein [Pseudomonadota bacterium]
MAAAKRYSTSYLNAGELNTDASLGQLRSTVPDILLNFNSTVLFGEDVLAIPRLGAVNFHPGPLPGYAGLHPNQWAILHGETEFGVTLHRMDMGIDTGDILLCSRFPIQQEDTGLTLFIKALREGQNLLDQLLDQLLTTNPKLEGTPQDLEDRGYFSTPLPNNGVLDFGWSAHAAANFIRALSYRPMTSPTVAPTILCKGTTIELSAPIEIVENEYHDTSGRLLE